MDIEKFKTIYGESRNGANGFIRHPLIRSFVMSDGVYDLAECGIWWLVDLAAFELPALMKRYDEVMLCLSVKVKNAKALLVATGSGDVERWRKKVPLTDMPEGDWMFYVADEGDKRVMILPTEY